MLTYGALIKVIAGFYIGCMGTIHQHTDDFYRVKLTCIDGVGNGSEEWTDLHKQDFRKASKEEWKKFNCGNASLNKYELCGP